MKNVEDVYPLSPMQEVMLFHALSAAGGDALVNQFTHEIRGPIDLTALAGAWQSLVDRHPVLRTVFLWQDLRAPLQAVRKRVSVPITSLDWRDLSPLDERRELDRLRADDRARGFDPGRAPLLRVVLIQVSDDRTWMVWTCHHLILDRWCFATVFTDLFNAYEAIRSGRTYDARRPGRFRDYIAWIGQQDPAAAEAYWCAALAGFTDPTPIRTDTPAPRDRGTGADEEAAGRPPETTTLELDATALGRVRARARGLGVTMSTVVQAAWALVLHQVSGRSDIVFGAVVAGRPPELPGVEGILGSFINNLPVRIPVDAGRPVGEWLTEIQAAQHRRIPYEHVSLTRIHALSELPASCPLFDHLLVWLSPVTSPAPAGLVVEPMEGRLATAYPLALAVAEEADRLVVTAHGSHDRALLEPAPALLDRLRDTLDALTSVGVERPLGEVPGVRADARAGFVSRSRLDGAILDGPAGGGGVRGMIGPARGTAEGAHPPGARGREVLEGSLTLDLLLAGWRDVLGREEVALDHDFFDAGGDSLLAVTLHTRIEAATRMSIPLLALFRHPTVRGMADTLREKDWPLTPRLVTSIQSRGAGPPLFCIASPEVNTVGYTLLARYLGEDRPIYVVQAPPARDEVRRLDPQDLLELAGPYDEAISAIAPAGPLYLLGMCSGAHVAVEMARRLRDAGRDVPYVGLVNTWAFYTRSRLYRLERLRLRSRYYLSRVVRILRVEPGRSLTTLRGRLGRLVGAPGRGNSDGAGPPGAPRGGRSLRTKPNPWLDEVGWARSGVEVRRFAGTITVYRIRRQQVGRIRDRAMGWGRFAERTEVEILPGTDHHAILREPHVRELARRVRETLVELQTEVRSLS